jgi:hypothetical protein
LAAVKRANDIAVQNIEDKGHRDQEDGKRFFRPPAGPVVPAVRGADEEQQYKHHSGSAELNPE